MGWFLQLFLLTQTSVLRSKLGEVKANKKHSYTPLGRVFHAEMSIGRFGVGDFATDSQPFLGVLFPKVVEICLCYWLLNLQLH